MGQVVAANQQTAFSDPQNGQSPIDAGQVTANDNALRLKFNAHDAEAGVHLQSGSKPAFGTLGRKWFDTDTMTLHFDTGAAWTEIDYLNKTSGGTVAGATIFSAGINANVTGNVTGNLTGNVTGNVTGTLTGNVTGDVSGNAAGNAATATILQTARNINGVSFNGSASITVTAAANTLTGSALPALNGSALTNITATNLTGIVPPGNLGTGASISTKFLRGDGQWITIPGGGDALTANTLTQFAATTSAQLASLITDETGTGALVFGTGPTITNATVSGGITLSSNALPNANGTIDLGSSALRWKDIWVAGDVIATSFSGGLTGNVVGNVTGTVSGSA